MRTTFIVELAPELVDFIYSQQGFTDPNTFINHVLREEKNRSQRAEGPDSGQRRSNENRTERDDTQIALEEFLDQNTAAAD